MAGSGARPSAAVDGPPRPTTAEWLALGLLVVSGVVAAFSLVASVPIGLAGLVVAATRGRWGVGEAVGILMLPVCAEILTSAFLRPLLGPCGRSGEMDPCSDVAAAELSTLALVVLLVLAALLLVVLVRWLALAPHRRDD